MSIMETGRLPRRCITAAKRPPSTIGSEEPTFARHEAVEAAGHFEQVTHGGLIGVVIQVRRELGGRDVVDRTEEGDEWFEKFEKGVRNLLCKAAFPGGPGFRQKVPDTFF